MKICLTMTDQSPSLGVRRRPAERIRSINCSSLGPTGRHWSVWLLLLIVLAVPAWAQTISTNSISTGLMPFRLNVGVEAAQQPQDVDVAIKVLFAITLLTL